MTIDFYNRNFKGKRFFAETEQIPYTFGITNSVQSSVIVSWQIYNKNDFTVTDKSAKYNLDDVYDLIKKGNWKILPTELSDKQKLHLNKVKLKIVRSDDWKFIDELLKNNEYEDSDLWVIHQINFWYKFRFIDKTYGPYNMSKEMEYMKQMGFRKQDSKYIRI